ncbi:MAG: hypothetical protein FJ150_07320 [Euryarchaeota archaeon]|nr:hypothetical protein [Euryarchaeota archaeon]
MRRKEFVDDEIALAFSTDAMLAIVIITVILGISADAMDIASYRLQDYSSRFSLERITTDAADILIKTPGSPEDWDQCYFCSYMTPGLAKINPTTGTTIPNTISFEKVTMLKNRYSELVCGRIIPSGANSSMIIYPINSTLNPIIIRDDVMKSDVSEIAVSNRTVLCDFMFTTVVIAMNTHGNPSNPTENGSQGEVCPHINFTGNLKHQQPDINGGGKPGWVCHHFKITQENLNSTDFYVITDPSPLKDSSARWIIDRTENITDDKQRFSSTPVIVNDKLSQVLGADNQAILWFHVFTSGNPQKLYDAYIVGVPKGSLIEQVRLEYLNPQPCFFVLKVCF